MPFEFVDRDRRAFEDPVGLIRDFWDQLHGLLSNLVRDTVAGFDFRPDLGEERGLIEGALLDAEEQGFFGQVREALPEADLGRSGLMGRSLSAKFGVLEGFSGQMQRGLRKALKYILDLVNSFIGSIKSALGPAGVVADAVAELKDLIKAKIDMVNGW